MDLEFSKDEALGHLVQQLTFGGSSYRVPGTTGRDECRDYIKAQLEDLSNMSVQLHSYEIRGVPCYNVLGKLNQGNTSQPIVILGAHYDTRAVAEKDPEPANREKPIPGANDGGSGVAVLLEIARVLSIHHAELTCQLWFVFFDAEDQGPNGIYGIQYWDWCEGSKKFVSDLDQFFDAGESKASIDQMILLDMVGGTNLEFMIELYSDQGLRSRIFNIGMNLGYTDAFPSNPVKKRIADDHKPFIDAGIDACDLIIDFTDTSPSGWPHHHRLSDDMSNIDPNSLEITGKTMERYFQTYFWNTSVAPTDEGEGTGGTDPTPGSFFDIPGASPYLVLFFVGTGVYLISQRMSRRGKKINQARDMEAYYGGS